MTPEQKIKTTIMLRCQAFIDYLDKTPDITVENVDHLWSQFKEDFTGGLDSHESSWGAVGWCSQDEISEFRSGTRETGLETKEWSRHYESREVAAKMFDGSYVGWTFWYGGGKHGEPQAIDWMSGAYELDYKVEEKLVLVETFIRKEL